MFNQMALVGKGIRIFSCIQMENHKVDMNENPRRVSVGNHILMDGYQIRLDIKNELAYLCCRKPSEYDLETLPHIIVNADVDWNPSICDKNIDDLETFNDANDDDIHHGNSEQNGENLYRTIDSQALMWAEFFDTVSFLDFDAMVDDLLDVTWKSFRYIWRKHGVIQDFNLHLSLKPLVTAQFASGGDSVTLKQHWRSRYQAYKVKRHNEPAATDTVFSDTPSVYSGYTAAPRFIGRHSLVADAYGLKTDKEFVNTLEDNIRERGAMDKLISNCAEA
jgi:hypothetical protein